MNTRIDKTKKLAHTAILTTAFVVVALFAASAARAEVCSEGICFEDQAAYEEGTVATWHWKAAGSAGQVDEGSQSNYALRDSDAYFRNNRSGNVILRYPVSCDEDGFLNPMFMIRYKDDGDRARVRVKLVATSIYYAGPETIAEFDSDSRPSSPEMQSYFGWLLGEPTSLEETIDEGYTFYGRYALPYLDCTSIGYHYEVRLTRGQGGDPRVQMLGLGEPR